MSLFLSGLSLGDGLISTVIIGSETGIIELTVRLVTTEADDIVAVELLTEGTDGLILVICGSNDDEVIGAIIEVEEDSRAEVDVATIVVGSTFTSEFVLALSSTLEDVTKVVTGEEVDITKDVAMVTAGLLEVLEVGVVVGGGCITEVDGDIGIIEELEDGSITVVVDVDAITELDEVDTIIEELDNCTGMLDVTIILDDILVDDIMLVDNWVGVGVILGLETTDIGGPV